MFNVYFYKTLLPKMLNKSHKFKQVPLKASFYLMTEFDPGPDGIEKNAKLARSVGTGTLEQGCSVRQQVLEVDYSYTAPFQ